MVVREPATEPLVARAFAFALKAHGTQVRKGTPVPYISHPLAVAALVMEHLGSDNEIAAAFLHDVVEDTRVTLPEIEAEFGPKVAAIVAGCTDGAKDAEGNKEPWRTRKERYLAHLTIAEPGTLLVSAADKLHNARAIVGDARLHGPEFWTRFRATPEDILWYYEALVAAFTGRVPGVGPGFAAMVTALAGEVAAMRLEVAAVPTA